MAQSCSDECEDFKRVCADQREYGLQLRVDSLALSLTFSNFGSLEAKKKNREDCKGLDWVIFPNMWDLHSGT